MGARFDIGLQFAMDWDLILRFISESAILHHLPDLFGIFRYTESKSHKLISSLSCGVKEMASYGNAMIMKRLAAFDVHGYIGITFPDIDMPMRSLMLVYSVKD